MTLIPSDHPEESVAYLLPFLSVGGIIFISLLSITCSRWHKCKYCCKKKEDSELHVELEVPLPPGPASPVSPASPAVRASRQAMSPEAPLDKHMLDLVKPKQAWSDPKAGNARADSEMETMRKIPSIAAVKQEDPKKLGKVKSGAKDYETMVNIGSDIWNPK